MRCSSTRSKVATAFRSGRTGKGVTLLTKPCSPEVARRGPAKLLELGPELGQLLLQGGEAGANRIDILAARRAVGDEAGAVMDQVDRHRPRRNADHRGARQHVLGHHRIGADPAALADRDRPQHLRARADHHAVLQRRMALAADPGGRIGPAQRDVLVDGDIVADLRRFADHGEAMVDEEVAADPGAGMDVDPGHHPAPVIDQPRQPEQPPAPQPVGDTVVQQRPGARVQDHVPPAARGGIPLLHAVEIVEKG
jgi:hypothetical protein